MIDSVGRSRDNIFDDPVPNARLKLTVHVQFGDPVPNDMVRCCIHTYVLDKCSPLDSCRINSLKVTHVYVNNTRTKVLSSFNETHSHAVKWREDIHTHTKVSCPLTLVSCRGGALVDHFLYHIRDPLFERSRKREREKKIMCKKHVTSDKEQLWSLPS